MFGIARFPKVGVKMPWFSLLENTLISLTELLAIFDEIKMVPISESKRKQGLGTFFAEN